MLPKHKTRFTEDEYLALERASRTKHEFIDGQIIAMAGGSRRHSLIAVNLGGALREALRAKPCVVFNSDAMVNVAERGSYYYPDVSVLCGQAMPALRHPGALQNPVLVGEVLSKSTESFDLNEKFQHFRSLPSLMEFLAVSQKERFVQHWHRVDVGRWLLSEARDDAAVELPSLGVTLPLAEIYEKVDLLPEEEE
jgi:Uma2 family endonuclease